MEIKTFAEQILFGNRLEDKLLSYNSDFTDLHPGHGIDSPKYPGRPDNLRLDKWGTDKKVPFPSIDHIGEARVRGQVLHFFANHELLAIELMALLLLKFPEAPLGFRQGVVQTIQEEQLHMKLYAEHMAKMNVEFGEIPVNDFFWECLSSMTSPLDFVAHMSLTFEQANLDFSIYYAKAFRKIGDVVGANILDKVFIDELGHVKHGLVWLNRWKKAHESDWDAYVNALRFPITPVRAKGIAFDIGLRKKIGFSEKFVSELNVYSHSRGRPANIYFYNPEAEIEASGELTISEKRVFQKIAADFAFLMNYLAHHEDIILLKQKPTSDFLLSLKNAHIPVAEIALEMSSERTYDQEQIPLNIQWKVEHRMFGYVKPWAQTASLQKRFLQLKPFPQTAKASLALHKMPIADKFFSKSYLRDIFGDEDGLSIKSTNVDEAYFWSIELLKKHERVVIKAPFSTSGRQRVLLVDKNDPTFLPWLKKIMRQQGSVVVEPWLIKTCDLSSQWTILESGQIQFDGWTRFLTDNRGQYLGALLGRPLEGLSTAAKKSFYDADSQHSLNKWLLQNEKLVGRYVQDGYFGPIGIDAFQYQMGDKHLLRPAIEVNPRLTMGRVAIALEKHIVKGQCGFWLLIRVEDILASFASLDDFAVRIRNAFPPTFVGPLIADGIVFTTDPHQAQLFVTLLCVGTDNLLRFSNLFHENNSLNIIRRHLGMC